MRFLIIDDNPDYRVLVIRQLKKEFPDAEFVEIGIRQECDRALGQGEIDVVITDYKLNWSDGLSVLREVKSRYPNVPVIMATDSGNEEIAVSGMKTGLNDYVLKKDLKRLPVAVLESLKKERARVSLEQAHKKLEQEVNEKTQANEELEALAEFTTTTIITLGLDELLDYLLSRLVETLRVDAGFIFLLENGRLEAKAAVGLKDAEGSELTSKIGKEFAERIAQGKRSDYLEAFQLNSSDDRAKGKDFGLLLGVPLVVGEEILGVLCVGWRAPHSRDARERHLFEVLADRCAMAIKNARLYEKTSKSERYGQALNKINQAISSTLDPSEIMKRAIEEAAEALRADSAVIYVRKDSNWEVQGVYGLPFEFIGSHFTSKELHLSGITAESAGIIISNGAGQSPYSQLEAFRPFSIYSSIDVPLVVSNELIGNLSMHYRAPWRRFTEDDSDFMRKASSAIALSLKNAKLYSTQKDIAQTFQKAMLTMPSRLEGIVFSHAYRSATTTAQVGGDFYDIFEVAHDLIGVLIGDVSGKGLSAATSSWLTKATVKAYVQEGHSPADALFKTNNLIEKALRGPAFISVFFGLLDIKTGNFTYCNAGHLPPILKRSNGEIVFLREHNQVIGVFSDLEFDNLTTTLNAGDLLFIYTDGFTEARRNGSFLGEKGFLELVRKETHAKEAPHRILKAVVEFARGGLRDDLAILVIERTDSGRGT